MEIKRRDFLKLFSAASGAVILGGCGFDDTFALPDELLEKLKKGPGIETWKNTVCRLCPGGCGIRVRLIDDVPVYVKGNPIHPVNQGGMCPLGLNALHLLYNPDRVRSPLKRTGKPGEGKWQQISWDEALKTISDALVKLRNEGKAHQVSFLGHNEHGLMHEFIARFMKAYGSPNYYQFSSFQNDGIAYSLVQGHSQIPSYDFLNATLILSFGANFLEEGYSPIYYTKLYSHHQDRGTRYIQIEPRISLTAANADRWIPLRPGTYGALALGIAYVLIREELYDAEFVRTHTHGFEDWTDRSGEKHLGFKSIVLGNYYPERVSEITGVSSETILEIAREVGVAQRVVVLGDQGTIDNTNGTFTLMAVHSLNALLGNFEKEGGIFFIDVPPFGKLHTILDDVAARTGNQQKPIARPPDDTFPLTHFSIESFTKNILADQPYPLSVLFLYKGNPLFQTLNQHDFAKALTKIPLVVSFDSVINETSEYAHLLLPDHTFLEAWEEISNVPSVGFSHLSIQQPVVAPFYDTKHTGDVLLELAKRIGGTVAASFPFEGYQEAIKLRMKGVYESGEGAVVSEGMKKLWLEYLQQRGWHAGRYESFEGFWDQLLERGGWWNPVRKQRNWNAIFQTPSGKFEFYSSKLKTAIESLIKKDGGKSVSQSMELILNELNISARGDSVYLPHYEPVPYEPDMPLYLTTFQVLPNRDGEGSNLPMMQEMFGYSRRQWWRSWVEIHPETAAMYGISDESWVWVESSVGNLKVQVKIVPGIMSHVIAIPFGMGHTSYGRYAKGHGVNPYSIMRNLYDVLSGKPALEATKVRISPVS
ncbi:MAG: molybdopterin-dependent oxidoreductase [Ignavibacteriae bacterium]|nr:molybdopterin-dependent oxidoreductase [Ignavibacteriota bacterium]